MELLSTRQAFGEALYEIMKNDGRVFALTADLGESLKMGKIMEKFPDRFIDTGVAEANMAGVAAGLALGGYIPVAGSFAVFLTRAFDHIRMQICQNNLHVIIVGSHGGVSNAADGASAHALEDLAYFRALPNMTILNPADYHETKNALMSAIDYPGPVYLRLYREPTGVFSDPAENFIIGRAKILRTGKDLSIFVTGPQTGVALQAASELKKQGVDAEVVAVATVKPLDEDTILTSARKTGRVVTLEDHSINGGLGSAVAELLAENHVAVLRRAGTRHFGESGSYSELTKKLGLDVDSVVRLARQLIDAK